MKTMNILNGFCGAALLLALSCCETRKQDISGEKESVEVAKEANDSTFTDRKEEKDADFIVNAVAANYGEIKMAQLAQNKSVDKGIKEMATKLAEDHIKVLNELKAYADKKGIAVPLEESSEDSKEIKDLDGKGIDKFDNDWRKAMESRHKKSIDKYETRMNRTGDAELRSWISSTLPGLKSHLEMLKYNKDNNN